LYDPLSRAAQFWVLYDPELRRAATEFPSDRPGAAVSVDAARRLCIHADMSDEEHRKIPCSESIGKPVLSRTKSR